MQLLIRDDDINYFTTPNMIRSLYGQLLELKIPISFGVIPAQRIDANRPSQKEVPVRYYRKTGVYPLFLNRALCEYLTNLAKQGVEICQHGLNHSYHEFALRDQAAVLHKINLGKKILEKSISSTRIQTFIAPYDYLSPIASQIILSEGINISVSHSVLSAIEASRWTLPFPPLYKYDDSFLIPVDHFIDPKSNASLEYILRKIVTENDTSTIFVLVNHYWDYFTDWEVPNPIAFGFWKEFCDQVMNCNCVSFNTFSGLVSQFSDKVLF